VFANTLSGFEGVIKKGLQEHLKADLIHSPLLDLDLPMSMNEVGTCAFLFLP